MSDTLKPRVRVPSGSAPASKAFMTGDNFVNFAAQLGYGAQTLASANNYSFAPITRNRVQLEYMYRSSWLAKQIVDAPADDMTRAGVHIESDMEPDDMEEYTKYFQEHMIWQRLNETAKWSRLYGGCLAFIMIEGQQVDSPLQADTIMQDQFKGLIVLDRWMIYPDLTDTVKDMGPDFGQPKYYQVVADVRGLPKLRIHYTRVIRMDGIQLPYWQMIGENSFGLSVLEPIMDRMVAFDSVTQGAAQLAFKAHLRVVKIDGLRELIATGGMVYQAFLQQMAMIRLMQTNEGLTVIDAVDEFQANSYSFAGLSDLLNQFGQQLSGASQIPLTRLFGQSPNGMSATGESDMRNYYDSIKAQQEARLRRPLTVLFDVIHRSKFGRPLPKGFNWTFAPLWQMSETDKATVAGQVTVFVDQAVTGGLISSQVALKELRQSSRTTGYWTNITDEDIKQAKQDDLMPDPATMGMQPGEPGQPGAAPAGPPGSPQAPTPPGGSPKPPSPVPSPGKEADSDDDAEPATLIRRPLRRLNPLVARMFPNKNNLSMKDMPSFGKPLLRHKQDVLAKYGHLSNGHSIDDVRAFYHTQDKYPMRDIHGMTVVIETEKGHSRMGYGWASTVGADYGYVSGTGSAEGGNEQFDCFVGEHPDSTDVWIVQQINLVTKEHDEGKLMLCFASKEEAVAAYEASFADGSGKERVGRVSKTDIGSVKSWLDTKWKYNTGKGPDHSTANIAP